MVNYRDHLLDDLLEEGQETTEDQNFLEDQLICECHVVGFCDLKTLVLETKKVDLESLIASTGLGTGCKSCLKNSAWWLKELEKLV
jgi:hypothetical protein